MVRARIIWQYLKDQADDYFNKTSKSRLVSFVCDSDYWESAKWFANGCFIGATLLMISPEIASKSLVPWITYLTANVIWFFDSAWVKNKPWFWMAAFFIVWDIVLIISRMV